MCLHRIFFVAVFIFFSFSACENDSPKKETTLPTPQDTIPVGARWIDANRWRMALQPDGRWGYDPTDDDKDGLTNGSEFPKGSDNFAIYAGGLYLGALKNGVPTVLEMNYGTEFTSGRIVNIHPSALDQLTASGTDSGQILFLNQLSDSNSPDLKEWPSDYGGHWDSIHAKPVLISDLDTWSVSHDLNSGQGALGVEVRRMTYSEFSVPWDNVTLIRFQIQNRSDQNYPGAYVSWWLDHNLGQDIHNDAIGTDTLNNMIYTYNLYPDITTTGKQYAIGHTLLYFSVGGTDVKWNSSYAYFNGADPSNDDERYRIQIGGQYHSNGNAVDSAFAGSVGGKYVYPGDPVTGTGTLCKQGRNGRLVGTVGPFMLESGKTYDLVVAVIGGEGSDRLNAVTDLRTKSDFIKNAFSTMAPNMKLK